MCSNILLSVIAQHLGAICCFAGEGELMSLYSTILTHSQKQAQNTVLGFNLKNDRMISACFQGKPFNITVLQVYAPTDNAKEAKLNGSLKTYKTF